LASKAIEFREKLAKLGLLRRSRSFKVIEVDINRKPVWVLVINTNRHPISYRFGVIAAYCSNFGHCVFEPPLGAYRQRTMFILITLELNFFSLCEALQAKIDPKSAILLQSGQYDSKFQVEGVASTNHLCTDS